MNIHIRGTVEFEKILSQPWANSIETTRVRMAVQQLLDTQESTAHLRKQLKAYIAKSDELVHHLSKHWDQPLIEQPSFEWCVNDAIIHTPCWRIESILPRFALALMNGNIGHELVATQEFKDARAAFQRQETLYRQCAEKLVQWKWKLSNLNHDVLQSQWHLAKTDQCRGMADLCMLCTGIQKQTASTAMFTVSQRALRHFSRSLATWPSKQAQDLMQVAEALRYYYSADILWNNGNYGKSIHRLERWQTSRLEFGPFDLLKEELGKVLFLAHERRQTNDGAYFETVTEGPALSTIAELIRTPESTDRPHPIVTPAWGAAGEVASTPEEPEETQ